MKLIFLFFTLANLFLFGEDPSDPFSISTPEQILANPASLVNIEAIPSTLVHDCVNVITGDFVDCQVDLVLEGSVPLVLERFYCSSSNKGGSICGGWNHTLWGMAMKEKKSRHFHAVTKGGQGGEYLYRGAKGKPLSIHPDLMKKGVTNCAAGTISGKTNVKNNRLEFHGESGTLKTGDGSLHRYDRISNERYLLNKIAMPNGLHYRYRYYDDKKNLKRCFIENKNGERINAIEMSPMEDAEFNRQTLTATAADGRQVIYTCSRSKRFPILISVECPNRPKETYQYDFLSKGPRLNEKKQPRGRFLKIDYDEAGKVKALIAPAGKEGASLPIYRFEYIPDDQKSNPPKPCDDLACKIKKKEAKRRAGGQTLVYDALGSKTKYTYSLENYRLASIVKYQGTTPYSEEKFYWGSGETDGQLAVHTLQERNVICYRCRYEYDQNGNPIARHLSGNLKGESTDCLVKKSVYSEDGLNLLLETTEEGMTTRYTYHPGTHLVEGKYRISQGIIRQREFYLYDEEFAAVKLYIKDDGTHFCRDNLEGVTERKIERTTNTRSFPYGLPEVIEEYGLEGDVEKLIKKTCNHYDRWGRLIRQEIYDCQGSFCHSLQWEYDSFGNVLKEIDALGQVIEREYDPNSNKVYEAGPRPDFYKKYEYDQMNRLVKVTEFHEDQAFTTENSYDAKGNKIVVKDIFGHQTHYEYDGLDRPIKETAPPVLDEHKTIYYPETKYEYDLFGNITAKTDPKGQTVKTTYTITGKPCQKSFPDGTVEQFRYSLKGELVLAKEKDGSYTTYAYDHFSRPVKEATYSPSGHLLNCVEKEYNAFHLLKETHLSGKTVHYSYDFAGRLASLLENGQRTTFAYDSLGREAEKKVYVNEEDYILYRKKYDPLNRLLQETIEDSDGTVFKDTHYTYDCDGNIIQTKNGDSLYQSKFDSFGNLIEQIDPEGNRTSIKYHYSFLNQYGVTVLCKKTIAPNHTTFEIRDALDRLELLIKQDGAGKTIQQTESIYDRAGNLTHRIERVITPEAPDREILHVWLHDAMNRPVEVAEAVARPDSKVTKFFYDKKGNLAKKIKPSGVVIYTSYDSLNRLLERKSSDQTVHEVYQYNEKGQLVKVTAPLLNQETHLKYDEHNRLAEEVLANGLKVSYRYDGIGRVTLITYPDQSASAYEYQGPYLKKVSRLNPSGETLYSHLYLAYDCLGNPTRAELAGRCGQIEYTYDLAGRIQSINTLYWNESNLLYDASGNLIAQTLDRIPCRYRYDGLDQLIYEEGLQTNHYTYDSLYNRLQKNESRCTYNDLCFLKSTGEQTYSYDPNGNLTGSQDISCTHDALDRLTGLTRGGFRYVYEYDHLDRRIAKKEFSLSTPDLLNQKISYLYAGQKEIGAYEGNQPQQLRLLGNGKEEIGAAVACEFGGKAFVPLHDHQGNCVLLLDLDGNIAEKYRYQTFGPVEVPAYSINPWQYASKRVDPESGFVYFGKRYYHPILGRWISPDPAGFVNGINLYNFNGNNPHRYVDPDGKFFFVVAVPLFVVSFSGAVTTASVAQVAAALAAATIAYEVNNYCQKQRYHNQSYRPYRMNQNVVEEEETEKKGKKAPPYNGQELGSDPTKCPGEGFEWKGKGKPGSKEGNWHNPETKDRLNPDLNHPPPIKPHWDYHQKNGTRYRLFTDGTWEQK